MARRMKGTLRKRRLMTKPLLAIARRPHVIAEAVAVLYMALIAATANGLHLFYVLFPELGALASDVLARPNGKWAKEPWKLVATPTVTAVAGVLVSRHLSYGAPAVLLIVAVGIGTIFALRSSVAPALSAGLLPLVLGVKSWLYPPSILLGLSLLTVLLLVWRRTLLGRRLRSLRRSDSRAIERLEARPQGYSWLVAMFLFTAGIGILAGYPGWRFVLFPPLLVMAYEMFGHPATCAWVKRPPYLPLACFLSALTGVLAEKWIHPGPLAVMVTLALTSALLQALKLRMPPALSIGLLPFVIPSPTLRFALSVGISSLLLTGSLLAYRRFVSLRRYRTLSLVDSAEDAH